MKVYMQLIIVEWFKKNSLSPQSPGQTVWTRPQRPAIVLGDGTQIYTAYHSFLNINNTSLWLVVDINGNRKPNTFGRDCFTFIVNKDGVRPLWYDRTREQLLGTYDSACSKNVQTSNGGLAGLACAALIMKDGWKISDDYPW